MRDAALFVTSLVGQRLRFKTCVLAQARFTQFLCPIPNKGGAYVQIGNPTLCSGNLIKTGHFCEEEAGPGMAVNIADRGREPTVRLITYVLSRVPTQSRRGLQDEPFPSVPGRFGRMSSKDGYRTDKASVPILVSGISAERARSTHPNKLR
jgi:hypothetical protein